MLIFLQYNAIDEYSSKKDEIKEKESFRKPQYQLSNQSVLNLNKLTLLHKK